MVVKVQGRSHWLAPEGVPVVHPFGGRVSTRATATDISCAESDADRRTRCVKEEEDDDDDDDEEEEEEEEEEK